MKMPSLMRKNGLSSGRALESGRADRVNHELRALYPSEQGLRVRRTLVA
jgi:hypothetical protein